MSNFVPLEEAAKRLGVSADELVEMRSRGDIFGYRDGASWKFKPEEIERVASELMGDALDEDPAGSSILVSGSDLGVGSKLGSTLGSDIKLAGDDELGSDVSLVPDPENGSDVKLVAGRNTSKPPSGLSLDDEELGLAGGSHVIGGGSDIKPGSSNRLIGSDLKLAADDDDDDELSLQADDDDLMISGSGLGSGVVAGGSGAGSGVGSDIEIGSDIGLSLGDGSDVMAGLSPVTRPSRGGSSGKDLSLSDEDDLVLGAGSDLALGNDSGINLMSPSDSGISLEDEPLDLAGSGISGLDLAAEGSDAGSGVGSAVGSGLGSGIEINQGEEFQLSPSGSIESEDDSGSQVIELEDSSEFGDAAVALPAADGGFGDTGFGDASGFDDSMGVAAGAAAAPAVMAAPDVPFQTGMVLVLIGILMVMGLSGILVSDLVRNMWQYSEGSSDLSGGFTKAVAGLIPSK